MDRVTVTRWLLRDPVASPRLFCCSQYAENVSTSSFQLKYSNLESPWGIFAACFLLLLLGLWCLSLAFSPVSYRRQPFCIPSLCSVSSSSILPAEAVRELNIALDWLGKPLSEEHPPCRVVRTALPSEKHQLIYFFPHSAFL